MNRFRALSAAALLCCAHVAFCRADAVPEPAESPRTARLPEVQTPAETPAAGRDVSLASYEELVEDDLPVKPAHFTATRLYESTWYTRVDYFNWREFIDGAVFMENNGVVPTLGYEQRRRRQRLRAELFGGRTNYFAVLGGVDTSNVTDYLGLRGEYEVMFEPQTWRNNSLFAGIGTRFFVRSTPDILIDESVLVDGYQETWWTFYPYIGYERRRTMKPTWEAYYRTRVGVTAFTWEHVALNDVTLFPRANVIVISELGFRGPRWHISAYTEVMAWSASPKVLATDGEFLYEIYQPASTNIMIGLKTGFSY